MDELGTAGGEFQFAWMDRIVDAMHAAGFRW